MQTCGMAVEQFCFYSLAHNHMKNIMIYFKDVGLVCM